MRTAFGKVVIGGFLLGTILALTVPVLAAPFAYITNDGSNDVSVIDLATNAVAATIPVGSNPRGVAVSPTGTRVYVSNYGTNDVSVIDTASTSVIATIPVLPTVLPPPPPVPPAPMGIAADPAGIRVYVADNISGQVTTIDGATNTVLGSVVSGAGPFGVAVHPSGSLVYVTNSGEDSVSVIDAATLAVLQKIPVGVQPYGIAVNPAGTRLYVANHGSAAKGTVSVIDTANNTVITNIEMPSLSLGAGPYGVVVNPAGTRVYVANHLAGYVAVIDPATNTMIDTIPVGNQPIGLSLNSEGTQLYVAMNGENNVWVIDTATKAILAKIPVGTSPFAFGSFVAQGALWTDAVSFSLKFTFLGGEDTHGNIKFVNLTQTFTGRIEFFESDLLPKQITFVSDDGKTAGYFRILTSIQTKTSARSESLLVIGTGDFASFTTGTEATGIAYLNAKGTLKKDSAGVVTSISLTGTIGGGVDQTTVFSATFRATLTQ